MYSVAAFCLFLLLGQFVPGSALDQPLFTWRQKVSQTQPFNGYIFENAFAGKSNITLGFAVDMSFFALDSSRVALENATLQFGSTKAKLMDLVVTSVNETDLQAQSRQYVDPCVYPYRASEGNFSLYGDASLAGSLRGTAGVDLWILPVYPLNNGYLSSMIYYATMSVPDAPSSEHYLNLKARLDSNSTVILAGGGSCPSTKTGGVYESYTIAADQELQVSIKVSEKITEYWLKCDDSRVTRMTWSDRSIPDWIIALIVIGCVLAAAIIALAVVIGVRKYKYGRIW